MMVQAVQRGVSGSLTVRVVSTISCLFAAAALLATLRVRWLDHGNGSSLTGPRLADSLRSGPTAVRFGWVATAVVYGVAAIGCGLLMTIGMRGRSSSLARVGGGATLIVVVGALASVGWLPTSRWAEGPWLVLVGALLAVASGAVNAGGAR